MKRAALSHRLLLFTTLAAPLQALGPSSHLPAGEVGFIEDFALSSSREEALKQLVPGTEDYYFYHCLHSQSSGRLDDVDQLLKTWIERHGRTARVEEMENRQALLRYPGDPAKALQLLRERLGLRFDHQREVVGEDPRLPVSLDPKAVGREAFTQKALERHPGTTDGFEERALEWAAGLALDPDRRRHLLGRLKRPDVPGLPRLVVDDLRHKGSGGFGSRGIHRRLLLPQLEECLRLRPELLNEAKLVETYLPRLWPGADTDWRAEAKAREAYLERLWAFASRLNASHNSLKAHGLYHRLAHDRALGIHDKERFIAYLKLPRNTSYVNRAHLERAESRKAVADLAVNYQGITLLPPVGNDEPLVRAYLEHFFLAEDDHEPYEAYLHDQYVRHVFAETKVLAGLGNVETWASMLPPAAYQALEQRVDLDFAPTNRAVFGPDEQVALDLNVKGVKSLIVKVFEVNTLNYYRDNLRDIDTTIDLDGLVANEETTHEYGEPAIRRVKRHFEFPSLAKRGAYVIDFIGGGKSSRALVRKGRLRFLQRSSTAGQVFTVLDESGRMLPAASLWLAGRRHEPDREGLITVPFSTSPGRQPIVLVHGDFAALEQFDHQAESYTLAAGFHVEREALLSRARAQVIVRPSLTVNGTPVTLAVLEEQALVIRSVDRDGVETVQEVQDFKLFEDRESSHELQVPANLARIAFSLRAKVQSLSRGKREDLEASRSFELNGIDATDKVECLHLGRAGGEYFLDLLGRTGEARPGRAVRVAVKHRDFINPLETMLQSGPQGRLSLGRLDGVAWIRAQGPEGTAQTWPLLVDERAYPASVHGAAGGEVSVPYMGPEASGRPPRAAVSLIELRGSAYVEDRFEAVALEDGYLKVRGLAAGDYELYLKASGRSIALRIAAGQEEGGRVVSPRRQLELGRGQPLQIASAVLEGDSLQVRLQGATQFTRVHVAATRYVPELPIFDHLDVLPREAPDAVLVPAVESLYVVGRDIGDEYRYILERQKARKFPGNMLARPSLLLNPWAIRSTETATQEAKAGTEHAAADERPSVVSFYGKSARDEAGTGAAADGRGFPNLDFLGEPAVLLANLRPDANGMVTIARKDLGRHQLVSIAAVDPADTAVRFLSLPEASMPFKDLRLTGGLDPAGHSSERKQVTIALKDAPFTVPDIATAELEVYDTLAKVHGLYLALSGDATLAELGFAVRWPALTPAEKREKYSKYACHELSFFLQRKDPAFFEEVVKPHLRNKHHGTFLDRWLLGEDLADYLQPWAFGQLNTVERILLASRIPGEPPRVARHVQDVVDVTPVDPQRAEILFQTALRGRALEAKDSLGIEGAQEEAKKLKQLADAEKQDKDTAADPTIARDRLARRRLAEKAAATPATAAPAPAEAGADKLAAEALVEDAAGVELEVVSPEQKLSLESFYGKTDLARRQAVRALYRRLDTTQEWVENNYYHLPIESQNADLVTPSAFWADFARHDGSGPFFSTRFAEASRSFTEMMLALAVLDLPFEAGQHEAGADGPAFTIRPASPVIIFHKQIKEAAPGEGTPILVTQHYYRNGDRHVQVGAERRDKFVTDELIAQVVYGCHVVLTNPTSTPQKLEVLLQVPRGSVPVLGARPTRSLHVDIEPYHTWTTDYFFYFPVTGTYPHFPVHVSKEEKLLAAAPAAELRVVDRPSTVDRASWEHVSQNGSLEDVLAFLAERNLVPVQLDRIAWRLRDRSVFEKVIAALEARHVYDSTLWSYGILHDTPAVIREYLRHAGDLVSRCGAALVSPLLQIDPVERKSYQHMEYWPLVNARAHRLGRSRQILNDRFHEQYLRLLNVLSYRPALDDEDLLAVTYYLLLQDRVEEALEVFGRVRSDRVAARMQYDYADAYLAFYREDLRKARGAAEHYASCPVERWRNLFGSVAAQIAEIEGNEAGVVDRADRDQVAGQLAATEPVLDLEVEGGQVKVLHRNVDECRVSYYLMDLELLFSRSPFVGEHSGRFSSIRPNAAQVVKLDPAKAVHAFPVPADLMARNVLVEVAAAGIKKAKPHLSGAFSAQVIESYAQARVTGSGGGKPLPGVYVKAYARMKDGGVRFYKDGYTDLRGRFDYGSLSTNEIENVDRFALLFLSPDHGAVVREAAPPKR